MAQTESTQKGQLAPNEMRNEDDAAGPVMQQQSFIQNNPGFTGCMFMEDNAANKVSRACKYLQCSNGSVPGGDDFES